MSLFWTLVGALILVFFIIPIGINLCLIIVALILESDYARKVAKNILIALAVIGFIIFANIFG